MMATSKFLDMSGRRTFQAKYQGACHACQAMIYPDDDVFYVNDNLIGMECCGGKTDEELTPMVTLEDGMPAMDIEVPRELVMPRGRTARDRCGKCFMVPASNGSCDC